MVQPHARTQDGRGKLGILVGAAPSLKKNIDYLKGLDENFVLVSCPTVLSYLREEGIRPNYVFALEGRDHWKSTDLSMKQYLASIIQLILFLGGALITSNGIVVLSLR